MLRTPSPVFEFDTRSVTALGPVCIFGSDTGAAPHVRVFETAVCAGGAEQAGVGEVCIVKFGSPQRSLDKAELPKVLACKPCS